MEWCKMLQVTLLHHSRGHVDVIFDFLQLGADIWLFSFLPQNQHLFTAGFKKKNVTPENQIEFGSLMAPHVVNVKVRAVPCCAEIVSCVEVKS